MKKKIIVAFILLCANYVLTAQEQNDAKIKAQVEKEAKIYRQKLKKDENNTPLFIEFSVDTFKIEHITEKFGEIGTTSQINYSLSYAIDNYDRLLNKYYQKVLVLIDSKDKNTLIKAQKAWLAYRDAEIDLIFLLRDDTYSGGGSIQPTIGLSFELELVKRRAIEIYVHLSNIYKME